MHVIFRIGPISRDQSFPGIPQDIANPITLSDLHVQTGIAHKAIPALDRVLRLLIGIMVAVAQFWQSLIRDPPTRAAPRPRWPRGCVGNAVTARAGEKNWGETLIEPSASPRDENVLTTPDLFDSGSRFSLAARYFFFLSTMHSIRTIKTGDRLAY